MGIKMVLSFVEGDTGAQFQVSLVNESDNAAKDLTNAQTLPGKIEFIFKPLYSKKHLRKLYFKDNYP